MDVVDLNGEWIGHYKGHYDEIVVGVQEGVLAVARKVSGDDFVPAGEVTWRADVSTGAGEGQVAEREFRRPRFVPGRLEVLNRERIVFHWEGLGSVEFRRDD